MPVATEEERGEPGPTGDCANECTLSITPLRVMNVPKIASKKLITTSTTFHFRSMPRFS